MNFSFRKLSAAPVALIAAAFLSQGAVAAVAPTVDEAKALINSHLNSQSVLISAPGMPSKLHDFAMVAEDPDAQENAQKQYHPAEKEGWRSMIAFSRALEKAGVMQLEAGTFFEDDFYDRRFKFTGYVMHFDPKMAGELAVMPQQGRVMLKAGKVGVDKIVSVRDARDSHGYDVIYTTMLYNRAWWLTPELEPFTRLQAMVGGEEHVTIVQKNGAFVIEDAAFLSSVKNPVADFNY